MKQIEYFELTKATPRLYKLAQYTETGIHYTILSNEQLREMKNRIEKLLEMKGDR